MNNQKLRIGFLASGNGSSARAIVDGIGRGDIAAEPVLMVSNRKDCAALAWARELDLAARCIPTTADPEAADARLAAAMQAAGVQLIVMSGYLRRLGPRTLDAYAGRILNIHPGPLPAFGGEGMKQDSVPLLISGLNQPTPYRLHFKTNLDPADLTATLELRPDEKVYHGYFTVLHVPGIHILWWGVYLMIAGGVLTWRRRARLARRPATLKPPAKLPPADPSPVDRREHAGVA